MNLNDLEFAKIPTSAMGRLAELRCTHDLQIALDHHDIWLRWTPGDVTIPLQLLAIPGCLLFRLLEGNWFPWGRSIPAFDVPTTLIFRPLYQVIFPSTFNSIGSDRFDSVAMRIKLIADPHPRPTTSMRCPLSVFLAWADNIPPVALARYRGVYLGENLLVVGQHLPWLDHADRFWGRTVLVPIGYRPDPSLSEVDMRRACEVADEDLLILHTDRFEVIPQDLFTSLSHASLRLCRKESVL